MMLAYLMMIPFKKINASNTKHFENYNCSKTFKHKKVNLQMKKSVQERGFIVGGFGLNQLVSFQIENSKS